jgi:hypothetical protein
MMCLSCCVHAMLQQVRIRHTFVLDDEFPDPPPLAELLPAQSPEREVPVEESVRQRIPYEEEGAGEEDKEVGCVLCGPVGYDDSDAGADSDADCDAGADCGANCDDGC